MLNLRKETKIKNKNSDNITKINAISIDEIMKRTEEFLRRSYDQTNANRLNSNYTALNKQTEGLGFSRYYRENEGRLFRKPYHKYLKIPIYVDDFSKERDKSVFTPENTNLRYLNTSDTRRWDGQNGKMFLLK